MKYRVFVIACCCAIAAVTSYAAAEETEFAVEPQDIVFEPVGGGKYLYNNNPEGIDDAAAAVGENPRCISSHRGLTPDTYYLYMSYFNFTGGGGRGYDIEVDVKITAKTDSVISIENASFETNEIYAYKENGTLYRYMSKWQFDGVCADMLGVTITDITDGSKYVPHEYTPRQITVKAGESIWLSQYFDEYDIVHYADPVHFQALLELESGEIDIDTMALKHNGKLGDRSDVPEDVGFGIYRYDYTLKGIADTLPQVETKTLSYTIDDSMEAGTILPGTVYNQYSPDGLTVDHWCSNINPVSDYWSKYIAVESDMIGFEYEDDNKLTYYGDNVKERDNIWRFDTRHTSASNYTQLSGKSQADYSPNFEVDDIFKEGIENVACNMGNYGVTETYNLEITNNGSRDRYFEYNIMTKSDVIVYVSDENGNFDEALSKGMTNEAVYTPMASVLIPAGETVKFAVNMFIPVNVNGGIMNRFEIEDKDAVVINEPVERESTSPIRGRNLSEVEDRLGERALAEFKDNLDSYEINEGEEVSLVRWSAWDGNHYYYPNTWLNCSTVYILDKNYELCGSYTVNNFPVESDIVDGILYVRDINDGLFSSSDNGKTWTKAAVSAIPMKLGFTENVGDIKTVTLTKYDGSTYKYDIDLSLYQDYIDEFKLTPRSAEAKQDRLYKSIVINDVYTIGEGIEKDGIYYVADRDMWLENIISSELFTHNTSSSWANTYIERAFDYGIVPLYLKTDEKEFTKPLTRIEFCDMIYRTLQCLDMVPEPAENIFTDCNDSRIMSLVAAGIINGVEDTLFVPDGEITREQAAAVLARTAEYLGFVPDNKEVYIADTISNWSKEYVYMMYNSGIMDGIGDDKFDAYGSYTKEQSITAQTRLYEYIVCSDAYNLLPQLPQDTKYYIVYRENYRNGRIELTTFDTKNGEVPVLTSGNILSITDENNYVSDRKYYLSCGEWIPFEKDYVRISNNSGGIIITNAKY